MNNKIEIVPEFGRYTWRVLTADDVLLCSGNAPSAATAANQAIAWTEKRA